MCIIIVAHVCTRYNYLKLYHEHILTFNPFWAGRPCVALSCPSLDVSLTPGGATTNQPSSQSTSFPSLAEVRCMDSPEDLGSWAFPSRHCSPASSPSDVCDRHHSGPLGARKGGQTLLPPGASDWRMHMGCQGSERSQALPVFGVCFETHPQMLSLEASQLSPRIVPSWGKVEVGVEKGLSLLVYTVGHIFLAN